MISEKKTEVITKTWWTCRQPGHRHRTKAAALKCLKRTGAEPRSRRDFRKYYRCAHDAVRGKPYRVIGKRQGCGVDWARQMSMMALKGAEDWYCKRNNKTRKSLPCRFYFIQEVREHDQWWLARLEEWIKHVEETDNYRF